MSSGGLGGSNAAPKGKKHPKKHGTHRSENDGGDHGHGDHGEENDDDFNAILLKEDMVNKFGRDPEDIHLSTMHPLGCMHGSDKKRVTEYEETWATRMVGGLRVIEEQIEKIAKSTDDIDTRLNVDEAGMDLSQHSTVLFCEICMKHSVVSYESYQRTIRDVVFDGNWKIIGDIGFEHPGKTGLYHDPFKSGAEYYLHIALTTKLILKTPLFSKNHGCVLKAIEVVDGDEVDGDEVDGDEVDGDEVDGDEVDGDEELDIEGLENALLFEDELVIADEEKEAESDGGETKKKRKLSDLDTSIVHKFQPIQTMVYGIQDAQVEVWDPLKTAAQAQVAASQPPSMPSVSMYVARAMASSKASGKYRPWDGIVRPAIRIPASTSVAPPPIPSNPPIPTPDIPPIMYGGASKDPSMTKTPKNVFKFARRL